MENKKEIVKIKNDFTMIELDKKITELIQSPTPKEFIKERAGKGSRKFKYITVGYTIAMLNKTFSPIGWNFEIVEQIIDPTEVVVKGKLSVKFPNGFEVSKYQYGTKERSIKGTISRKTNTEIEGVPLGDTLKAAASDALKKCASMFGIGLDVYWNQLDNLSDAEKPQPPFESKKKPDTKIDAEKAYNIAFNGIKNQTDPTILREWRNQIGSSSLYTELQIVSLIEKIDEKLCQ